MTDKERYKQAFSSLHASGHISLEVNMNHNRKFHPTRKLIAAFCPQYTWHRSSHPAG